MSKIQEANPKQANGTIAGSPLADKVAEIIANSSGKHKNGRGAPDRSEIIVERIINEVSPSSPSDIREIRRALKLYDGTGDLMSMIGQRVLEVRDGQWIEMMVKHSPNDLVMGAVCGQAFMVLPSLALGMNQNEIWKIARAAMRIIKKDYQAFAGTYRSLLIMDKMMTDHDWLAGELSVEQEDALMFHAQVKTGEMEGVVKAITRKKLMRTARQGPSERVELRKPKL